MPWPNDVVTRTVYGTYLTALGAPAKGRVTFTPTSRVVDINDSIIVEGTLAAELDATGSFSIDLPTTDNQLLSPINWAYKVSVRIYGVRPQVFYAVLPYGDGSDVDIRTKLSGEIDSQPSAPASVQGPVGPRGPGTLIGEGTPNDTLGFDGDLYIDSTNGYYYGPKSNGEWPTTPIYVIGNTRRHVHTQGAPSSTWTIAHTLGGRPSVTVVDSAGTVVIGEVSYNSDTEVTIYFTSPFSGFAYLT